MVYKILEANTPIAVLNASFASPSVSSLFCY